MDIGQEPFGPPGRDELASWSTAPTSDGVLGRIPAMDEPSPAGRTRQVGGVDIFVRETAAPTVADDATDAWYIHGLEGMSRNWDRLAAALAPYARGFAPDLPGSGQSPPPAGRYRLVHEADLLATLIRHTSRGPVHLVGNSRGGIVATFLAARHPDVCRSVTLISPAVPDFRPTRDRGADPRLALVMFPGAVRVVDRMLSAVSAYQRAESMASACFGEPEALTEADLAAATAEYELRSRLPWAHRDTVMALRSLIRAQLRPARWSFAHAAGRVTVPVLIVWGTRDRLVDVRLARRTAGRFPDARLLVLPRTGHVAQMERPARTAAAMLALWTAAGASSPVMPSAVAP